MDRPLTDFTDLRSSKDIQKKTFLRSVEIFSLLYDLLFGRTSAKMAKGKHFRRLIIALARSRFTDKMCYTVRKFE